MSMPVANVLLFGPRARAVRRFKRMQHGVITASRLIQDSMTGFRHDALMVTLTYRNRHATAYSPYDVSEYIERLRKWLKRKGHQFRYVWVLEDQQDGTPHYHIIVWVPKGQKLPMPDKSGMWPHGMSRIEIAKGSVGYLAHYAAKLAKHNSDIFRASKALPKAARIWGRGGLTESQSKILRWWRLPSWLRDEYNSDDDLRPSSSLFPPHEDDPPSNELLGPLYCPAWMRVKAVLQKRKKKPAGLGGWISKATGEHIESKYIRCYVPAEYARLFFDVAPSPEGKRKSVYIVGLVKREDRSTYLRGNVRFNTDNETATYKD